MQDYTNKEEELATEILRYLWKNPGAKDTLEGIARWWLRKSPDEQMLFMIERAISLLLSKDFVLETCRKGLPPFYRMNSQKHDEILILLRKS